MACRATMVLEAAAPSYTTGVREAMPEPKIEAPAVNVVVPSAAVPAAEPAMTWAVGLDTYTSKVTLTVVAKPLAAALGAHVKVTNVPAETTAGVGRARLTAAVVDTEVAATSPMTVLLLDVHT